MLPAELIVEWVVFRYTPVRVDAQHLAQRGIQVLSALWVGAIAYCNVELAVAAEDHRPTIVYGAIQGCKFHEDDFAIGQGVIAICGKTADAVKVTAGYGIKDVIVVVDLKAGVKDEPAQTTLVVIVYFNTQEWVRQ